jgi:hypothetical protein
MVSNEVGLSLSTSDNMLFEKGAMAKLRMTFQPSIPNPSFQSGDPRTISMRRFWRRPSAVSLGATGL